MNLKFGNNNTFSILTFGIFGNNIMGMIRFVSNCINKCMKRYTNYNKLIQIATNVNKSIQKLKLE